MVQGLPEFQHPDLIVGAEGFSDAGVYRLRDDLLIVQSLDFFPPLVDDPFLFGQIAAANSLSDIYAMGARPTTVLNIVGFPDDKLELSVLGEILRGGADQVKQADAVNRSDVWATLCGAYIISLSLDQADEACDTAVETGPSFAALNNRGVLRAYRRDFDGAREDFDRARPLQLEAYLKELMARDVRLVAADNYRLISKVLARRGEQTGRSTAAVRTADIEEPGQKLRH